MTDLHELARAAAEAAEPPSYESLARRAHVRRGRRRLAIAGVASAAVAAVVVGITAMPPPDSGERPSPATSGPSPSTAVESTRHGVTAAQAISGGDLWGFAVDGAGDLFSAWAYQPKGFNQALMAWRLAAADGHVATGFLPDHSSGLRLSSGRDYFVAKATDTGGILVHGDGTVSRLRASATGDLRPGAAWVMTADGVDPVDGAAGAVVRLRPPGGGSWTNVTVTDDGTFWGADAEGISWRKDDGTWHQRQIGGTGTSQLLAASGRRVAAYAVRLDHGDLAVVEGTVSTDGGGTWSDLSATDLPFTDIESLAATADGTLFVSDGTRVYRSTDGTWTRFDLVPGAHSLHRLQAGDRAHPDTVYGYGYRANRLYALTSAGGVSAAPRQLR